MKPKVDSNLSTKRVKGKSKRKLLNIPKECKRVKMNDKCYLEFWRKNYMKGGGEQQTSQNSTTIRAI